VLVEVAPTLSRRAMARACRSVLERITVDDIDAAEDLLRAQSGLRVVHLPDGLVRWIVTMHPEAAGMLTAALDARTAPRRRVAFETVADDPAAAPAAEIDRRPLAARRLDALVGLARDALTRDTGVVAGAPVTMVVTVPLAALRDGLGSAQITGIDQPISAATARRLASDARIIPAVLGSASEPLGVGRAIRLATSSQRVALAIRDGGCLWPGCDAPPGWCDVAHIEPWARGGPTDLTNLMLLCPFHHRRFDLDGWQLRRDRDETPWFIPSEHTDRTRRPRRGGRGAPIDVAA
jgi:hypothetical protein